MKYKYELIGGEIKVGDKVLHGVFYGVVKGFSKDHKLATVDFSNGANEPNLKNNLDQDALRSLAQGDSLHMVKVSELKRCGDEVKHDPESTN